MALLKYCFVKLEPVFDVEESNKTQNAVLSRDKQPDQPAKNYLKNSNSTYLSTGNDLKSLLLTIPEGRALLAQYSCHERLTDEDRGQLADILIGHEFSKQMLTKRLSLVRIQALVKLIIQMFPTEKAVDWIKFVSTNKKTVWEGKFIQRYNTWRSVTKCLPIQISYKTNNFEIAQHLEAGEKAVTEVSLTYLRIATDPKAVIEDLWEKTMKQRHNDFNTHKENLYNYFQKFPCLREPLGLTLLEKDFQFLYPQVNINLFAEWPKLSMFIENILRLYDKKFLEENTLPEAKMMKLLMNFSQIFPSIPVKHDPSIGTWCPSKAEAQDSFFLVLKSIPDLQPILDQRSKKLRKYGLSLQPLPVVIGSAEKFVQCFIILDTAMYEVDNPLKAVDLTFKIFHALHLRYPPECEQIWTFLQRAVYKLDSDSCKKYPGMTELVSKYLNYHLVIKGPPKPHTQKVILNLFETFQF